MFYDLLLGAAQGIAEWLPISSEGLIVFIQSHFTDVSLADTIRLALFLHLGTFFAALLYFWREVWDLVKNTLHYNQASTETKKLINFYIIATLISGALGFGFLQAIEGIEDQFIVAGRFVLIGLGVLLLVTALLQLLRPARGQRTERDLNWKDSVIVGIAQGFAVFPGLSRSGLTTSMLLLRRIDDMIALRVSFILSLLIVLGGNIVLNADSVIFTTGNFIALGAAFVFGLATIHLLLRIARKMEFGWFVLGFAVLVFASAFFV